MRRAVRFGSKRRQELNFDPLTDVKCFDDLKKFPLFEDDWLRGGPLRRWVPKGHAGKPTFVFETGGTTGIPKSRVVIEDHWKDYELFSDTLPDKYFPRGSNWLMLGPSGPRRLRLAVEHLAQYRDGICFCIDLDPRWVVKLIKKGWMEHLEEYKKHCIDQAITVLTAGHDVKCMFAHAQIDRVTRRGIGGAWHEPERGWDHRNLLGRYRVHTAVDTVLRRRTARWAGRRRWRLHDTHLRQHFDGTRLQQANHRRRRLQDQLLRTATTRCDRSRPIR